MPVDVQGGKGGSFFLTLALLHFVLLCRTATWWPKRRAQGCSPRAAEGAQGWGPKPEGEEPSTPHVPLLKLSCSSHLQMAEVLMFARESLAEACDVHRHAGTLKPRSPLLWIPLDQTALHIRLYFNSCLTLPVDLKRCYKKESKARFHAFYGKFTQRNWLAYNVNQGLKDLNTAPKNRSRNKYTHRHITIHHGMFTVAFEADIKILHRNRDCSEAPQEKWLAPVRLWTDELESKDNGTGPSFFHLSLSQVLSCPVAE